MINVSYIYPRPNVYTYLLLESVPIIAAGAARGAASSNIMLDEIRYAPTVLQWICSDTVIVVHMMAILRV